MSDTGVIRRGWVKIGSHPIEMGYLESNKLYDFHFDNAYGYYYVKCEDTNLSSRVPARYIFTVYLNYFEIIFLDDVRDERLVDLLKEY